MPTLLVVDDEPSILHFFRRAFREPEVTLLTAGSAEEALAKVTQRRPDVVILDIHLPDQSGLEAFERIRKVDSKIPVIFITGHGTTAVAIEAMRLGAYEYLLKPLELDHLSDLVSRAFEISRLMRVPAVVPQEGQPEEPGDSLVGRCPAMQEVYKAIGRVAPQNVTVLILGESGTGKELVARAIYHYSPRSAAPFHAINCSAIPEALLESELFGHEKGAFTGADRKRIGRFEQCNGGTLFLDEIGDMTALTQTKILRVLQDQQFERVGGNETIRTDVRLIAATNRDLEKLMGTGHFRSDVYYRLNIYSIKLPPLRERTGDIPVLVEHFLKRYGLELGKEVDRVAPEALAMLRRYPWPGNVRELQSALKQALLQATGSVLLQDFLPPAIRGDAAAPTSASSSLPVADLEKFIQERLRAGSSDIYVEWQHVTDRFLLSQILLHTGNNLSLAAKLLGLNRSTLRTKLRALGISVERSPLTDDKPG